MTTLPNPILAKKIIQRLKAGTTPLEGVRYVNVGHERYYQEIERLLDDLTTGDGADVHFLKADYGFGKTHFIGMVNALALDKNWVTSYVSLSKEQGVRLDKFDQLYAAILRNCVCRGLLESRQNAYDPGEINGWTWILDDWIRRHLQAEAKSGIDPKSVGARDRTLGALDLLLKKTNVSADFAVAVRLYAKANFNRENTEDSQLREAVLRWFACEDVKELRQRGVLNSIKMGNAKLTLRSMTAMLREFGYGGMAFFVDEAENAQEYSKPQRRTAYQNLREMLDNVDGRATGLAINHAVCYVAATPVMFVGEKGFREYPALQDRIEEVRLPLPGLENVIDYRAVIIDLAASPLTSDHRRQLARRIRDIHAIAFRWDPQELVSDDVLDLIVTSYDRRATEQGGLRPLCRAAVTLLEIAQQHPDIVKTVDFGQLVSSAVQQESRC